MKKHYHITIEGSIGVGKTSLAKLLAEEINAKLVLEEFEENPFLSDFYKDTKRYAFQTQLFFLLSRYSQHQDLKQVDIFSKTLVLDYMFIKDRLFAALNLSNIELELYNRIANELQKNIVYPDLVIFLQSDTDRLMENIKKRGKFFIIWFRFLLNLFLTKKYRKYFVKSPYLIDLVTRFKLRQACKFYVQRVVALL